MILGLTENERRDLMSNVARRLEEVGNDPTGTKSPYSGIKTSQDVYNFQTAGVGKFTGREVKEKNVTVQRSNEKLVRKMEKAKEKFDYNKRQLARARRLLACCNALLARDSLENEPTIYTLPNPLDNNFYHDIDELKMLSRQDLKFERLKLDSQKAKFESKVAKGRLKLYGASRALVMTDT